MNNHVKNVAGGAVGGFIAILTTRAFENYGLEGVALVAVLIGVAAVLFQLAQSLFGGVTR